MIDKIYNTKKYCKRKKLKNEKKSQKIKTKQKKNSLHLYNIVIVKLQYLIMLLGT